MNTFFLLFLGFVWFCVFIFCLHKLRPPRVVRDQRYLKKGSYSGSSSVPLESPTDTIFFNNLSSQPFSSSDYSDSSYSSSSCSSDSSWSDSGGCDFGGSDGGSGGDFD